MTELANARLAVWGSFYVIVGSSSAALIGLECVVITLIAGMRRRIGIDTINAFGTPTVVHLAGALIVSAVMSAPWSSLLPPSVALAWYGFGGIVYGQIVTRRTRRQTGYRPVRSDWAWYVITPPCLYALLALAAIFLETKTRSALFVIGAAALGLLLIGIHNAWDTMVHMAGSQAHGDEA